MQDLSAEEFDNFQLPEVGQLVSVRRRQWLVADVNSNFIKNKERKHSLVTLSSIDEDALGEQIEIIWEIEPGAKVMQSAGLPVFNGEFDNSDDLDAFLNAVRWGTATNIDRGYLQAPFRSGINIEDFQLDPLVRAIDMARTNLLIADDVGLGKTIEAGLVIQEMMLRHRARTALVLCPASLKEKWRAEMEEKFGLEFKIIDSDYVSKLRRQRGLHANPWTSFPRLIASIDWAKQEEGLRLLRDALPTRIQHPRKFDLLVIDEAHNVAPTVSSYTVESLRTKLVRMIAPHFQHKLFLTATPHNGFTESFTALLELLDDQRFARNADPNEAQLARVMIRRLKSDLVDADGNRIYPNRRLAILPIEYSEDEKSAQELLKAYIREREHNDKETKKIGAFVYTLLKKRLASSPAAFSVTLARHIETIQGQNRTNKSHKKSDERRLRRAIAKLAEDYDKDDLRDAAEIEAIDEEGQRMRAPSPNELEKLQKLQNWANGARHRPDAKADAIINWLKTHIKNGENWTDERVILFTEYKTTQSWLQEILVANGFGGDRLNLIYGGMDDDEREAIKAGFQADPQQSPVRILLATDAASEGIDLQNHCRFMIHIEIPYNPNVMEQRNGRIDRHGQKASEVLIWHPVSADGQIGDDILRALQKLETMRSDMGSVNPVIAPQIPDLLEGRVSKLDTTEAEIRAAKTRKYVKVDNNVRERVVKLHDRLNETKSDQGFFPENIEKAVRTALSIAEMPPLEKATLHGFPNDKLFIMPSLSGSWNRCMDGLAHPFTGKIRPITFDHELAKGRDDVVLVHLGHRLVQMSLRLLRSQTWAQETQSNALKRIGVYQVSDSLIKEPMAVALSRLVIVGGNHHRLHEEITEAGGYVTQRGFRREPRVTELRRFLNEATPTNFNFEKNQWLLNDLQKVHKEIFETTLARSRERLRNLTNTIETRRNIEIQNIQKLLDELDLSLARQIDKDEAPFQYSFDWAEDKRLQVTRDVKALQARRSRIPEEKDAEITAINNRHSNAIDHTFPVAIKILLPQHILDRG